MDDRLLAALPPLQRAFAERALPALASDPRTLAIAGAGSWATGGLDEFSDLDLVIVVRDEARDALVRDALAIAGSLGDLLVGFPGHHVGAPNLLICLYAPALHVDLKFVALDELQQRIEDPVILFDRTGALEGLIGRTSPRSAVPDLQWMEDRFWVWVHYAATKLGRGELFEALDAIHFLRAQVLCPLAARRQGYAGRGNRRVEARAQPELAALQRTVAGYDADQALDALRAALALYVELREHCAQGGPLLRRERARAAALGYLEAVAARRS